MRKDKGKIYNKRVKSIQRAKIKGKRVCEEKILVYRRRGKKIIF
jgi:hypothetical protein